MGKIAFKGTVEEQVEELRETFLPIEFLINLQMTSSEA